MGQGKPYYDIERCFVNVEGRPLCPTKAHIRIVNGAYRGDDAIGMLMRDLSQTDPEKLQFPVLRDIFGKILNWLNKFSKKEKPMTQEEEEQEFYDLCFGDEKRRLEA